METQNSVIVRFVDFHKQDEFALKKLIGVVDAENVA